jgi:hypothetical protein
MRHDMLVTTQEAWCMTWICEIRAIPGINLLLRRRWRFAAVNTKIRVITLQFGESEPFWSSAVRVAPGEREGSVHRRLLQELTAQGWQPSNEGDCGGEWYSVCLNLPQPDHADEPPLIEEHDDHWVLLIEGYTVTPCGYENDFPQSGEICYLFEGAEDGWRLRFSSPFTYRAADGQVWVVGPEETGSALTPALAAFGLTVERAVAYESGRLDLAFADGSALSVEPLPLYEAWEVWGPRGVLLVSIPGGDLAVWSDR